MQRVVEEYSRDAWLADYVNLLGNKTLQEGNWVAFIIINTVFQNWKKEMVNCIWCMET